MAALQSIRYVVDAWCMRLCLLLTRDQCLLWDFASFRPRLHWYLMIFHDNISPHPQLLWSNQWNRSCNDGMIPFEADEEARGRSEWCQCQCKDTYMHTYIHTDIQTYIHTDIQTDIHTYRHTDRHTYRHTYIHTCIHASKNALAVIHC